MELSLPRTKRILFLSFISFCVSLTGCKQDEGYIATYPYAGYIKDGSEAENDWVNHGRDVEAFGSRIGLENKPPFSLVSLNLEGSNSGKWEYFEFPKTVCMNNTKAGLAVNELENHEQAKNLLIYFQPGNACFDGVSCSTAHWKNGYSEKEFTSHMLANHNSHVDPTGRHGYEGIGAYDRGIFNRKVSEEKNPFKGYNYISIPYCTGDGYMGSSGKKLEKDTVPAFDANDITTLKDGDFIFRGYFNVQEFITWIVDRYKNVENVVVMGQSAGAIGALYHFKSIHDKFESEANGDVNLSLIEDSGFTLLDNDVKNCAQAAIRSRWKLDEGLKEKFNSSDDFRSGEFMDAVKEQVYALPDVKVAHIRGQLDPTLAIFYGFAVDVGQKDENNIDCTNGISLFSSKNRFPTLALDPTGTKRVTKNFHDNVVGRDGKTPATVRSWLVPASTHQWILGPSGTKPSVAPWKIDMPGPDLHGFEPGSKYYYRKNTSNSTNVSTWLYNMLNNEKEWRNYWVPNSYCDDKKVEGDPYYEMDKPIDRENLKDGIFMELCNGA